MVEMTPAVAAALRAPFPDEAVGYLPKIWCKACSDANKQRRPSCDNHTRRKCPKCRNNITEAHVDLSYVGHAETTDRLIAVDPEWTWEPMAFGQDGLPALDQFGGLWIRLSVAGVTRPGYGGAAGKTGPDMVKELIGDAIRNAAMRFGVAINLWGAHGKGEALAELAALTGEAPEGSHTDAPAPEAATAGHGRPGPDDEAPRHVPAPQRAAAEPAPPSRAAPQLSPERPAAGVLDADTRAGVEEWTAKVEHLNAGALDATGCLTQDDRDALGDRLEQRVTLDDLCAAVLGYWHDHGHGPRQESAPAVA